MYLLKLCPAKYLLHSVRIVIFRQIQFLVIPSPIEILLTQRIGSSLLITQPVPVDIQRRI